MITQNHRVIFLTLFSCCFVSSLSGMPISGTTGKEHSTVAESSINKNVYVEELSAKGQRREVLVIRAYNHIYRVPDERVSYIGEDGRTYFFNDDDNSYGHDFELSPDKNWLFVGRKCMHAVAVGYLYHRISASKFVPVRPDGLRFDAAAIQFFARTYGTPHPLLSQGTWIIGLKNWDRTSNGLTFTLTVGRHGPKYQKGTEIEGHYDLSRHKFKLVSKKTTLTLHA